MPELLEFHIIIVNIPRKTMLRDLEKSFISPKKFFRYRKLKKKLENASYQLGHANSILDKILLKSHEYKI